MSNSLMITVVHIIIHGYLKKKIFHRILKNSDRRLTKNLETRQKVQEYRTDIITARRKQLTIFRNNAYCTHRLLFQTDRM